MTAVARTAQQRKQDALRRLENDVDAWVATAGDNTGPHLIPLSFLWDGSSLIISTPASSPTSRNLLAGCRVRVGIGPTRDLVLVEGTAEALTDVDAGLGDVFATKTGFDPRELEAPYQYFRILPRRLQAWREANELEGRDLMRNGEWLVR